MDVLDHLRRFRRRPVYKKVRSDPSTYLTTARLQLLRTLPPTHRLYSRATETGTLIPDPPANLPRGAFTEEELQDLKARRRFASDPDDLKYQLQDSKLVEMWNADYEREEQWREYDQARPVMEFKRDLTNLPDEVFDPDDVVGEKRKRVVSAEYRPPVRQKLMHDYIDEEDEIEEGEIGLEEDEETGIQEQSLQTLMEMNERLSVHNAMLRALAEGLPEDNPSPPVTPLRLDSPDGSDCESDDSGKAVCGDEDHYHESDNHEKPIPRPLDAWIDGLDDIAKEQASPPATKGEATMI